MNTDIRTNATIAEIMEGIKSDPEGRRLLLAEYRRFKLQRLVRRLVGVAIILSLIITLFFVFTACNLQYPEQPELPVTLVKTEIVTVQRTGTLTTIIETATGQQHGFELVTTRRLRLRGAAPSPRQSATIETESIKIITHGSSIIIFERQTQAIHVI